MYQLAWEDAIDNYAQDLGSNLVSMNNLARKDAVDKLSPATSSDPLSSEYGTYKTVRLGFQIQSMKPFLVVPSLLGSGAGKNLASEDAVDEFVARHLLHRRAHLARPSLLRVCVYLC